MSDFDKEAEREKLREKYGEESDERAATRQMSELLLKGATMTNKHCDTCGDPVFRYDGQEFCPTCQSEAGTDDAQAVDVDAPSGEGTESETATGTADDTEPAGGERPVEVDTPGSDPDDRRASATRGADGQAPPESRDSPTPGERERGGERRRETQDRDRGRAASSSAGERAPATTTTGTGDRRDARASLERTLARFARAAEESEDPRAAREHLAAAREAAEALAALRR